MLLYLRNNGTSSHRIIKEVSDSACFDSDALSYYCNNCLCSPFGARALGAGNAVSKACASRKR